MKYYEFSEPYYALIAVENKDKPIYTAIKEYDCEIADIDDGFKVSECTKEYALNKYKIAEIENCSTEEEITKEFENLITINEEKYNHKLDGKVVILLLVDRDLI